MNLTTSSLDIEQARFNMIEQQVRPWDVLDVRVLDVLRLVHRESFVRNRFVHQAFSDLMLPLEHDQVMMSPVVEGRMLQALAVRSGEKVLEIGTGSGFIAACLAQLGGQVTSVELFADLSDQARNTLEIQGYSDVVLETGDASQGWNDRHTYDVIAITGAMDYLPESYKKKLNLGGRLFVVLGSEPNMVATLFIRAAEDSWEEVSLFETSLPYLLGSEPVRRFSF
ncbi:MAG: protein-L-isoaspartate O-methyltransferase [Pseudomonadota bacterium]